MSCNWHHGLQSLCEAAVFRLIVAQGLLTPDHVRAIFNAARVDQLGDVRRRNESARGVDAVGAWVEAFEDKAD